ncbi:MAG TPA: outer membrane beta-barrel protein [Candidatus Brocadiia bacterium]|nr:outer membrane beta-barrel protein [Candidatus Brocadiia bacterium]
MRNRNKGAASAPRRLLISAFLCALTAAPALGQDDAPAVDEGGAQPAATAAAQKAAEEEPVFSPLPQSEQPVYYRTELSRAQSGTTSALGDVMSSRRLQAALGAAGYVPRDTMVFEDLRPPRGLGFRAGPVSFYPSLSAGETWTSNLYLTKNDAKSSFMTRAGFGLSMLAPLSRSADHQLLVDYALSGSKSSGSTSYDTINQGVNATVALSFPDDLKVRASAGATYAKTPGDTEDDRGQPFALGALNASVHKGLGDLYAVEASYSRTLQDMLQDEDDADTFTSDTLSFSLLRALSPKTSLVGNYKVAWTRYKVGDRDNTDQNVGVGLRWSPRAKWSGGFLIGYEWRDYDKGSGDTSNLSFSGDVGYEISPKARTAVRFFRGSQETSDYFDNLPYGNSYVTTGVTGSLDWLLASDLQVSTQLSYVNDAYTTPAPFAPFSKRNDDLYGLGVSVTHTLPRNVSVGLDFQTSYKESNISEQGWNNSYGVDGRVGWSNASGQLSVSLTTGYQQRNYDGPERYVEWHAGLSARYAF